jgi:hypothetical protein
MDETEKINYKLGNVDGRTLEEIERELENGGRFVIFQSHIGLLIASFKWPSKAYLVPAGESLRRRGIRYSIVTMVFGWWELPHGPVDTIRSLRLNLQGGVDVTEDILANLTEESLQLGVVTFEKMKTLFIHVNRHNFKAIAKAVIPVMKNHSVVKAAYVGVFINTPPGVQPYFIIGIETGALFDMIVAEAIEAVYKPYRRDVPFKFVSPESELWQPLIEQGESVYVQGLTSNLQ